MNCPTCGADIPEASIGELDTFTNAHTYFGKTCAIGAGSAYGCVLSKAGAEQQKKVNCLFIWRTDYLDQREQRHAVVAAIGSPCAVDKRGVHDGPRRANALAPTRIHSIPNP